MQSISALYTQQQCSKFAERFTVPTVRYLVQRSPHMTDNITDRDLSSSVAALSSWLRGVDDEPCVVSCTSGIKCSCVRWSTCFKLSRRFNLSRSCVGDNREDDMRQFTHSVRNVSVYTAAETNVSDVEAYQRKRERAPLPRLNWNNVHAQFIGNANH